MLVLDSGGVSRLSQRSRRAAALIAALRREGLWPPVVPTVVLAESTTGAARTDTNVNRFLKTCDLDPIVPAAKARRAGQLRARARRGSAVDALLVALAEPGSTVLTSDRADLDALASYADGVDIEVV
jgi:predicted nucleic acid-binding protein